MHDALPGEITELPARFRAYVLLDLESSAAPKAAQELRRSSAVILVDVVNSDHELIAVVEGDAGQLAGMLFIRLKEIGKVRSMKVLIAPRRFSRDCRA